MSYLFRVLLALLAGLVALAMLLVFLAFLVGCAERGAVPIATSNPVAEGWLGRWHGPEGTFLLVEGGGGRFQITVQNLDGPRSFEGTAVGDRIQFERDGMIETISATNGADTGMKWLSDKTDCLTIRFGEGYCRD